MFDLALEFCLWLFSGIDADWQIVLAVPLVIVLLLLTLIAIVRLLPVVDRILGPLGTGLSMALGTFALLPEFACTTALRRWNRAPPGFLYAYGDGVVGLVHVGERVSKAGLSAFTRDRTVRKLLILFALVAVVAVGNANTCVPQGGRCVPPLTAWVNQVKALAHQDDPPPKPKPPKKPTKKATPKKT